MLHKHKCVASLVAALTMLLSFAVRAGDASTTEIDALRKDIEDLRKKLNAQSAAPVRGSAVDKALESKYGPNATVTTKNGKLTISGLVQVWYYSIQNDNEGLFQDNDVNGIVDTNEASDNDSFRIRRAELKFTMDIHENVTAVVCIDPATENSSFPNLNAPGANNSFFKTRNNVEATFVDVNGVGGSTTTVSNVQNGSGSVPRLLKDAYINYHGVIPHHDFQIGQFVPPMGEESLRSSAQLDFVERSMVGQLNENRDLGLQIHGFWWDERFQYWLSVSNGAGNYFSNGVNRSDDNDEKDLGYRVLLRPLWNDETWGSIELGFSSVFGTKGESAGRDQVNAPVNGLNRNQGAAMKHAGWASYKPGGPVRGWWIRGEWAFVKDRNVNGVVTDLTGNGDLDGGFAQGSARPFSSQGWYVATGYKLSDSIFCDNAPAWLKPWEFAFRYQVFENVQVADLNNPLHTDNFKTQVWTAGVNYYIKGHNAKIQANYNVVNDPDGSNTADTRRFHSVSNDNFVVNFQVAF